MRNSDFSSYNISKKNRNYKKNNIYLPRLLYIGQGLYKIRSKEMIHHVKEAQEKAFETVEGFT